MSYGLLSTGFSRKPLSVIISEIGASIQALIDSGLDVSATGPLGQLIGAFGDQADELWEICLSTYNSQNPDSAEGAALEALCALTKTYRLAATSSTVTLDQLNLDNGTTLPAGQIVSVSTTGLRFVTLEAVSNTTGSQATVSVAAESENTGPVQGYATTIDTIETPIVGWSATAALTSGNAETYALSNGQTLLIEVDEGSEQTITFVTGDFVAIGSATAAEVALVITNNLTGGDAIDAGGSVRIRSDTDGEGSALQITGGTANTALGFSTTLVKGFNTLDADPGQNIETDEELRIRREELLRGIGAGSLEAIRARLLLLDDILQVFIFENDEDTVDINGLPPHSFETVISGGDEQEIADEIFASKPVGIDTYGSTSKQVEDSQGFFHTIEFSRPTDEDIYIDVTVQIDAGDYPTDGDDQIKTALVAEGDTLLIGEDVIALRFKAIPLDIAGVIDVTVFEIDTITPPVNTGNIVMGIRDLARFDTSRITVTTV
jgi:hypothetical protein